MVRRLASYQIKYHVRAGVGAMAGKLTDKTVKAPTAQARYTHGRYTDGDGLHLYLRADGNAAWGLRYRLHGQQRDLSLLPHADKTLKVARDAAAVARVTIKAGKDPIRERQRQTRGDRTRRQRPHVQGLRGVRA